MPQDEQLELLREIARWTREAALPVAKARVERLLDADGKKRVYETMADGTAGVTAIEKSTGVNHNDINQWLKEWKAEGIVEADSKTPKALFTLSELGIDPAPARRARTRKATE
jgi:predicted Rossmann fold nucleotide-binding protein DprA/Smf involved in DNA uptake